MVLSGDTEIVQPVSVQPVSGDTKIVQKDPKDKDREFDSFVLWFFLNDFNDSKDLLCTRLQEKVLPTREVLLRFTVQPLCKTKIYSLLLSFKHILRAMAL